MKQFLIPIALLFFISIPAFAMDGNVLYLPFDTDMSDSSGNGLDGTANGDAAISSSDCKFGSCLVLDGDGDYVTVADNALLNFGTDDFSVEFWEKMNVPMSDDSYVNKMFYSEGFVDYRGWFAQGQEFYIIREDSSSEDVVSGTGIDIDGEWHHVVALRRGNTSEYWVDGILDASSDFTVWNVDNNNSLTVGIWGDLNDGAFNGTMDEVRLWNYALTEAEIGNLMTYNSLAAPPAEPDQTLLMFQPLVLLVIGVGLFLYVFKQFREGELSIEKLVGITLTIMIGLAFVMAIGGIA